MPEGHTLYRIARHHDDLLGGHIVRAESPQGRFVDGAALLDGHPVRRVTSYGKHLFYDVTGAGFLHIHLGLYGKFRDGPGLPPPARGAVRLRLTTDEHWIDLRGATAVEVLTPPERRAIMARLGPDPLRRTADGQRFVGRAAASRAPIATILMDQTMVAGIGNVYRAELLFRAGLDPYRPGRDVGTTALTGIWEESRRFLRLGVRQGRIITTDPVDRGRRSGPARVEDAHYVYRRDGLACRRCGTAVRRAAVAGRNLFWCPQCQR